MNDSNTRAIVENAKTWSKQKKQTFIKSALLEAMGDEQGHFIGLKSQFPNGCVNGNCGLMLGQKDNRLKDEMMINSHDMSMQQKLLLTEMHQQRPDRMPFSVLGDIDLMGAK